MRKVAKPDRGQLNREMKSPYRCIRGRYICCISMVCVTTAVPVHIMYYECSSAYMYSSTYERAARGGGGGGALPDFFFFSFFPCLADHERDWPPCKVVFFGLATNALNVRNNNV